MSFPSRSPIWFLKRQRCGSIRVKTHGHKAFRHKSEPPTTFDFLQIAAACLRV
ncbi:hypothetical protein [Microcoleus sp. herbarium12]|uniref:hypothetical protein n=1 Tax=Microcoleus sp. herbarium12 TaxID=3055437 RepID=UPI002FCF5A57